LLPWTTNAAGGFAATTVGAWQNHTPRGRPAARLRARECRAAGTILLAVVSAAIVGCASPRPPEGATVRGQQGPRSALLDLGRIASADPAAGSAKRVGAPANDRPCPRCGKVHPTGMHAARRPRLQRNRPTEVPGATPRPGRLLPDVSLCGLNIPSGADARPPSSKPPSVDPSPSLLSPPSLESILPGVSPSELPVVSALVPSNDRQWEPDQEILPRADFHGDKVTVRNIRNCSYLTEFTYTLDYYDETYDLGDLQSVDFIVVPFAETAALAHTMLSFGFAGDRYLAVSVEIRREEGEQYSPLKGLLNQYELMYVVADERDLILLRTIHRLVDVHIYRAKATPEQARSLFVDVMRRVNKLHDEPEFYNTITNNCTTNIVEHINRLAPGTVPYDYHVLLPGYSDRLAYDLGLLDTDLSFERLRERSRVNYLSYVHRDSRDFSRRIREALRRTAGRR
jgi:hypothetical protein